MSLLIRIFLSLIGFGFAVIGMIYIINYLNLISLGYNFLEYVKFICRRPECLLSIFGLILIILTIFTLKGADNNDICI